jgi:hypothetical protein
LFQNWDLKIARCRRFDTFVSTRRGEKRLYQGENRLTDREADAGIRTPDPFITSEVLYQLSYVGTDVPR